jgi:hypothetical protein
LFSTEINLPNNRKNLHQLPGKTHNCLKMKRTTHPIDI